MKHPPLAYLSVCVLAMAAVLSAGCATQRSVAAKPLKPTGTAAPLDLTPYEIVTVTSFASPTNDVEAAGSGERLASDVAARLKLDFPGLFQQVRLDQPLAQTNEVVVSGQITKYHPGSRMARFMLVGLGPASLEGTVVLKEGSNGRELMSASFDKLWAWGGVLGVSKGITEMMGETAASLSATIARGKGWQPTEKK